MLNCELCLSPLTDGRCPVCSDELRARVAALAPDAFPRNAMVPPGAVPGPAASQLASALVAGQLEQADQQWAVLAASLRPLGPEGRRQLGACLDAWAALKTERSLSAEADRLRQRAATAVKDPQALRRKQATREDGSGGWDNHAWVRLQAEDAMPRQPERVEAARLEVEAQTAVTQRRIRFLKVVSLAVAGAVAGSALGQLLAGVGLGAGLGWLWASR